MRVAFLTQWLHPEGRGLIGGIARVLVDQGAQVALFTGDQVSEDARMPIRKRERLGLIGRRADVDFAPVVRYPTYASHDDSAVRRLLTYGSFTLSSLDAVPTLRRADVVLAYCSPATAAFAALAAQRWGGPPVVLMIQDVWPDSVFATGFMKRGTVGWLAEKSLSAYVDHMYRSASAVTALSPGMRQLLIDRGTDPERTHVIYNWTEEDAAAQVVMPERVAGEPLHLMYAGNMGPAQNLGNVLRALSLLPQDELRLSLVGDGAALPQLRELVASLGLSNVAFVPRVPKEQMPEMLSTAHLHLVSLADEEVFRITLPSKFQSLVAAGLPILSVAPGEVGNLVRRHEIGFVVPPDNPAVLAEILKEAVDANPSELLRYGQNGLRLYSSEMSREVNSARLYDALERAAIRR